MAIMRKTVLATAMLGAGLASTTGAAFADQQEGPVNVNDVQTIVPTNICDNNVPVNVLGIQVPLQDVVADIPILSGADHHSGNSAGVHKSCGNGVKAHN